MHFKIAKSAQSYFNNIMNLEGSHAAEDKNKFIQFDVYYCCALIGMAAGQIDEEVLSIINTCYNNAYNMLEENKEILDKISNYLFEKETITGKEFMQMYREMKGIPEEEELFVEEDASEILAVEEKKQVELLDDYFEED